MCKKKCEHPERLDGKEPGECSEEQIRKCHGKKAVKKGHPCTDDE